MKKVIGFVGMPGSGKSTALNIAQNYGSIVVMGDVVREETLHKGLEINSENLGKTAKELRAQFGPEIVAQRCIEKVVKLTDTIIFIDGLRSISELNTFKKAFPIQIVAIHAPDHLRHEWLIKRGREDDSVAIDIIKNRDQREIQFGLLELIKVADYTLENLGSKSALEHACEELIKKILNE